MNDESSDRIFEASFISFLTIGFLALVTAATIYSFYDEDKQFPNERGIKFNQLYETQSKENLILIKLNKLEKRKNNA